MSTATELGYEIGQQFVAGPGASTVSPGSIVELTHDDGSACPYFKVVSGDTPYNPKMVSIAWARLTPVDPTDAETFGPLESDPAQAFKADAGKPRWVLLMRGCYKALASVVRVLTFAVTPTDQGGKGYVPHSWKEVPNAKERYEDALYRHLDAIRQGETKDPESGELHWAHVATNALFLAEFYESEKSDVPTTE